MGCASSVPTDNRNQHNQRSSMTVFSIDSSNHSFSSKKKKINVGSSNHVAIMNIIRHKPRKKSTTNVVQGGYVKTNSVYGRRKPTEDDFKFIEQRQEMQSQNTDSTYLSASEYNSEASQGGYRGMTRLKNGQVKTVMVKASQVPVPSAASVLDNPFWGALDYQTKFNQLKDGPVAVKPTAKAVEPAKQQPRHDIEVSGPRVRKAKVEESPRMEVVYHISRDEFNNAHTVQPSTSKKLDKPLAVTTASLAAPPISIVHTKAETLMNKNIKKLQQRTDSFISSQDDLSENSFVVAHNTLKVAWEQDYQQLPHQRLNIVWQPKDPDSGEDSDKQRRNPSISETDEILPI